MHMAVKELMVKRRSLWSGNEFISESMDYLKPRITRVQELFDAQEGPGTEGLTAAKNSALDHICGRCWLMSKRLTVYARRKGLLQLLPEVDHPKRHFDTAAEVERIGRCAALLAIAQQHVADLAPFKITQGDLTALATDIEALRPLSGQRDAVGDEQQVLHKTLPQLLKEIQEKLYELDDEIISFMDDHPEFQEEYFTARRITDRRG